MRRILLLAGEESGVMYARQIADGVRRLLPEVEIRGYADYGFQTEDLAVMGFGQVIKRLGYFLRVKRTLERAVDEWRPDVVCTVDYPGLNLKLAAYARRRGIRAVHVVCPQVWAWRSGRIPKIEASLDRLCCFFPFEPALFRPGFAEFVGHPLVDAFAGAAARVRTPRRTDVPALLALLPGSRMGEIERILPVMLDTVAALEAPVRVEIPAASDRAYAAIRRLLGDREDVKVLHGGARELLLRADLALVASGTATLEAALARCPTVLVYKAGWFLELVARLFVKGIGHIGLANIIAEKAGAECPMPELLQQDFTPAKAAGILNSWLKDEALRLAQSGRLDATVGLLGSAGDSMTKISRFLI